MAMGIESVLYSTPRTFAVWCSTQENLASDDLDLVMIFVARQSIQRGLTPGNRFSLIPNPT